MPTINAVQVSEYGEPDQLKLTQIERPEPKEGEVLVRVHAAGVNPFDWKVRSGMYRDFVPVNFPYIPGGDLAGVVEALGAGVTAFQVGQEVYGSGSQGSYTEYALALPDSLALKPRTLSYDEAAAVPAGAVTAWQGLFDYGNLQADQRVLILGGSGGVGLFAVQFARWKGAHVIATTSTDNAEFVRSLGAETVVDYRKTRVEDEIHDVDLVFDTVGGNTLSSAYSRVKRGGTLITIAGQPDEAKAQELGIHAGRFSAQVSTQRLDRITQLIDSGEVKVFIQEVFPLGHADKAHELSQGGHGRGRIILHIA